MVISEQGYALRFNLDDVPILGNKAAGVKAMNLKKGDVIKAAFFVTSNSWYLLTQRGFIKRMKTEDIPVTSRANRGLQVLRTLKTNNHTVFAAGLVNATADLSAVSKEVDLFTSANPTKETTPQPQILEVASVDGELHDVVLTDLTLSERTSNGHPLSEKMSQVGTAHLK